MSTLLSNVVLWTTWAMYDLSNGHSEGAALDLCAVAAFLLLQPFAAMQEEKDAAIWGRAP